MGRWGPSRPRILTKAERAVLDKRRIPYPKDIRRPRTRGECRHDRPCPFVACRYHLYLHVDQQTGRIKIHHPDLQWDELSETCSLDVADKKECTLEEVAVFYNVSRERIRQIEYAALGKLYGSMDHINDEGKPFWQDVQRERRKALVDRAREESLNQPEPEPEPEPESILDRLVARMAELPEWKREILMKHRLFQAEAAKIVADGTPAAEVAEKLRITPNKIVFWSMLYRVP